MREILPRAFHWTVVHAKIKIPVHSYYLATPRVLIDPMVPKQGIEWFEEQGPPEHIVLTNRHHYRHSSRFVKEYGTAVRCHRAGLHEFKRGERVEPFENGDELPGGILALEVGVLCPEETALYIGGDDRSGGPARARGGKAGEPTRAGLGILAFGDALIRDPDGELGFVPEEFMGDDPKGVKRGLRAVFRELVKRDFDTLLMAHGEPIVGGAKEALRSFARQAG